MKRVILRHVSEPSSQRLLLEKADIDMARNLTPDQVKGVMGNSDISIDGHPKGTIVYMAANAGHPILGKTEVVQAIRNLVDYESMANSFLAGQFVVHQAFWPGGLWGALEETPYKQDVAKAKSLLQADQLSVPGDCPGGSGQPGAGRHQGQYRDPGRQDPVAEISRARA
jgi:peptide/nickel transport system substrate-binding protein